MNAPEPEPRRCCRSVGLPGQKWASAATPYPSNAVIKGNNEAVLAARQFAGYSVRKAGTASAGPSAAAGVEVTSIGCARFMEVEQRRRLSRDQRAANLAKIQRKSQDGNVPQIFTLRAAIAHQEARGTEIMAPSRGLGVESHRKPDPPPYRANYRIVGGGRHE